MNIYNLLRHEFGYTRLVCDIENLLGWDDIDFVKAYSEFFINMGMTTR